MMTKFMNKQRGLLAAIMALVMVFAGVAIVASDVDAAEGDAAVNTYIVSSTTPIATGEYADIPSAIAAADEAGDDEFVIELKGNVTGPGVKISSEKTITIDFKGYTYTVNKCVGSSGTETSAFQILKNSTVILKNGTITTTPDAEKRSSATNNEWKAVGASRLIQSYANVTFDSMILDGSNVKSDTKVVACNNNGTFTFETSVEEGVSGIKAPSDDWTAILIGDYSSNGYDTPATLEFAEGFNGSIQGGVSFQSDDDVDPVAMSFIVNENVSIDNVSIETVGVTVTVAENKKLSTDISYTSLDAAIAQLATESEVTIETEEILTLSQNIIIPANKTLTIVGATIVLATTTGADGSEYIYVPANGNLILEGADVRVPVIVEEGAYVSITKAKKMTVDGDATADLGVGYGNTLVLSNLTVPAGKSIDAYGNVVIEGNVTVQKGANFNVYAGGDAQIKGNLVIEGTATVKGNTTVEGTVKVTNADGNAKFVTSVTNYNNGTENKAYKFTVSIIGSMDVLKGKNKNAQDNVLSISAGDVNVEGTLNITGTLTGNINDMGIVNFNGKSVNGQVTIFDGMTLTIASVSGDLRVIDAVDTTDLDESKIVLSNNNSVTLNGVKNVTVSTEVTETVYGETSESKKRYYALTMTVSGAVSAVDETGSVTIANTATEDWPVLKVKDCAIIIGDVTVGKGVSLAINTESAEIIGTITVSAEGSSLAINGSKNVDVLGTIVSSNKNEPTIGIMEVDAATYTVSAADLSEITTYYTSFEAALAAASGADEKKITVLGAIDVKTEVEVPAGIEVDLGESTVKITVDGKVTVAADALLTGGAKIDVKGMLVIMDKESGFDEPTELIYQVYTESGDVATYSGLVLALQNAVAGDVITIVGDSSKIEKSVTIPEGVTLVVPKGTTLEVGDDDSKVVLTVAGELQVAGTVSVVPVTDDTNGNPVNPVEVLIPGVITYAGDLITTSEIPALVGKAKDYVSFLMKVDGKNTSVFSNLTYASENATDGDVTVYGTVSAGDITFTMGEKSDGLIIAGASIGTNTMSVSSITLVCNGKDNQNVALNTTNLEVTGTVASAAGSVDLSKVKSLTVTVGVVTDVDGTTDIMTVAGTPTGSVEIVSGTVTAVSGFTLTANKDKAMSIASDATLVIDTAGVFINGTKADKVFAIVDGTISIIEGGELAVTYATVNGNIDVASAGQFTIGTDSVITGTITVAEKTDDAVAGTANIANTVFIGAAPAIGATGTLVGPFNLTGAVVAYPGSDLSGALINDANNDGVSDIEPTEFYINGQLYMTVLTKTSVTVENFALSLNMEISGVVVPTTADKMNWFSDESLKTSADNEYVSQIGKVYAEFDAAEIDLIVSAGVGLQVYIDGLAVENYKVGDKYLITVGTHTVSFAVESGYDGSAATITVNGVQVANGGTFTVDVDADKITIIASGAVPAQSGSTVVVDDADDGMALTDILLIVLVVLIVIMAIIVALRMMRS